MDKFSVLKTDRLQLRRPAAKDLPDIIEYAGNPKIAEMTLNIPHPYHEKNARLTGHVKKQGTYKERM